jgi:hypothetical protein
METTMTKNLPDDALLNEPVLQFGGQPPPLSEDLIAQLQNAVKKARQIRTAPPSSSAYPERRAPKY